MLTLLWLGDIDLNMYTLPVVLLSAGTILIPTFLSWTRDGGSTDQTTALAATSLTLASTAAVWLLSPLRFQAEMGVFLILCALVNTVIPLGLQKSLASRV